MRYHLDSNFRFRECRRRADLKASRRDGIADLLRAAVVANRRSRTVERRLGYSVADVRAHLEQLFQPGMDWDVFATGAIHIDHVIPKAAFDLTNDDEWRECWALENLQPLWAADNLRKAARLPDA